MGYMHSLAAQSLLQTARSHAEQQLDEALLRLLYDSTIPFDNPSPDSTPWDTTIHPSKGNLEPQFAVWHSVASDLVRPDGNMRRPEMAREVWAAMYLLMLRMQVEFGVRVHKALPLCNIGYALGRLQSDRRNQGFSWFLGAIEDTLSSPESATAQLSFSNLVTMRGTSEPQLRTVVTTFHERLIRERLMPMMPEQYIQLWLSPSGLAPSPGVVESTGTLLKRIGTDLRELVVSRASWITLKAYWDKLPWPRAVIGD